MPKQIEKVQNPFAEYTDEELDFLNKWIEAYRAGDLEAVAPAVTTAQ